MLQLSFHLYMCGLLLLRRKQSFLITCMITIYMKKRDAYPLQVSQHQVKIFVKIQRLAPDANCLTHLNGTVVKRVSCR